MGNAMPLSNRAPVTDGGQPAERNARADLTGWMLRGAILLSLILIVYVTIVGKLFHPLLRAAEAESWARVVVRPSILWAMMGSLLLIFRTVVWLM